MKNLFTLSLLFFLATGLQAQEKCYFFVSGLTDVDDDGLSDIATVSNVVTAECDIYQVAIQNQFREALKAKHKDYWVDTPISWGPYETSQEAAKERRKRKARYSNDDVRVYEFTFRFYED